MSRSEVRVRSGGGGYPVLVQPGLRHELPALLRRFAPAHRYAVISDSNVAPLYGEEAAASCRGGGLSADLFVFPAGEKNKTRGEWASLTDRLLAAGFGRDAVIVAVGGGVVGDLAGFVASTLHRGVPVVQVPTSLVAMIDASVGGKTGVDVTAGKNLVGAFHPPRVVVADPETVSTLPVEERAQGLAEAVKHGAIADASHMAFLEARADALLAGDTETTSEAVTASVGIKASVVSRDEHEAGLREILNFGHTVGHALEAASAYAMGHGSAVSAGMILEARLGERLGVTEPGTGARLAEALARFGLGPATGGQDVAAVLGFLRHDKKARGGVPRCVFLRRVGEVDAGDRWSHPLSDRVLDEHVTPLLEELGDRPL